MKPIAIIDTAGQYTPIVEATYTQQLRSTIGRQLLKSIPQAGQVAFIDPISPNPQVVMMGNELSANGSLASGYYLTRKLNRKSIDFFTSGINQKVSVVVNNSFSTLRLPQTIVQNWSTDEVWLRGIKYKVLGKLIHSSKAKLRQYCGDYPAAGFIFEKSPGEIITQVYVKNTDTVNFETACGSASIAYYCLTGCRKIKQPSGFYINIEQNSGTLAISTGAKETSI